MSDRNCFVFLLSVNFYVYFRLSVPLLERLAREFGESRGLLSLIPLHIRVAMDEKQKQRREMELAEGNEITSRRKTRGMFGLYGLLSKFPRLAILLCAITGWAVWFGIGIYNGIDLFGNIANNYVVVFAMVFGSFIAGSTPIGGGTIAFPVMSALGVPAPVARDFSFAIQSMGMGTASIYIVLTGVPIDSNVVNFSSFGALLGSVVSTLLLEGTIPPSVLKVILASVWTGFGVAVVLNSVIFNATTAKEVPQLNAIAKSDLVVFGLLGGLISGLTGSGVDFFVFARLPRFWLLRIRRSLLLLLYPVVCGSNHYHLPFLRVPVPQSSQAKLLRLLHEDPLLSPS